MKQKEILQTIGKRLKERRKELELTQAELSYKCDTDPSYIRKVESGKVNISIGNLAEMATALEITLSELLVDL